MLARIALVVAVAALCLVGIGGAALRAVDAASVAIEGPPTQSLSRLDAIHFEESARAFNLAPGSPSYARIHALHEGMSRKFWTQPTMTLLHVLGGIAILVLGPLQLWPGFRAKHPAAHRWGGRVLLAAAAGVAISGFWFGLVAPTGGTGEALAVALFGGFFAFAAFRAYWHIRRREVRRHREWMIRMFAVALGSSTIRIVALVAFVAMDAGADMVNPRSFALMFWAGWLLTLAVAELWILRTRLPAAAPAIRGLEVPPQVT